MLTGTHRCCALLALLFAAAHLPAADRDEYSDPFLGSPIESDIVPIAAEDGAFVDSPVRTADVGGAAEYDTAAGPDSLFPNGPPAAEPELSYPDGAVPIQYPLDDRAYRGVPDAFPGAAGGWTTPAAPPNVAAPSSLPPGAAVGWKSVKASLTEVFGDSDSLGITSLDLRGTLEFARFPGVFVTPQFGWHLLNGPSATDLPSQLYDMSLDFSMYRPVGESWMFNLALTPSLFTDGDNLSGDAVRVLGRAMAYYTASPTLQWAGGIVYLDRADLPVLPALGVICTPRDDVRFELMFPKPRLAWRQWYTPDSEQWVYVTGELGGQSWGVVRASGADDIATYRDLRFVLGLERKQTSGRSWYVEGGYVFGREVEYESNVGGADLSATGFLRVGGAF